MNDKVQAALKERKKKQRYKDVGSDRARAALEQRETKIKKNIGKTVGDLEARYASVLEAYKGYEAPGFSENMYDETLNSQNEARSEIEKLKADWERYRYYIDDEKRVGSALSNLDTLLAGYDRYVDAANVKSGFKSEADYNTAVREYGYYEKYKDMDAEARAEALKRLTAIVDGNEFAMPGMELEHGWLKNYDAAQNYAAQQEEYLAFDTETERAELERQQKKYEEAEALRQRVADAEYRLGYTGRGSEYIDREKAAGELDELRALYDTNYSDVLSSDELAARRVYLRAAENAQTLQKYNAFAENADFEEMSARGKATQGNMVVNARPISSTALSDDEQLANQMSDDEKKLYSYILATSGEDEANHYFDALRDTLTQRLGGVYADIFDYNALTKVAFAVSAGVDQFKSGMEAISDEEAALTPSATQIAGSELRESMGGFGRGVYDVIQSGANMLPSILVSTLAGAINPGLGSAVGTVLMGTSAGGNAYAEMKRLGYSDSQAQTYGVLVGASEAALEKVLGGIGALGGAFGGKSAEAMVKGIDNAIARVAARFGMSAIGEATEEGLQEVLTPLFENLALGADNDWSDIQWSEAAYSALIGAITGGVIEGATSIVPGTIAEQNAKYENEGQRIIDSGSVDPLMALAKETAEAQLGRVSDKTSRLADAVQSDSSARNVGRLSYAVRSGIDTMNEADLAKALVDRGMDEKVAADTAKRYIGGRKATAKTREAYGQAEAVASDPESAVARRNKRYADIKSGKAQAVAAQEAAGEAKADAADVSEAVEEGAARREYEAPAVVTESGETVQITRFEADESGNTVVRLENGEAVPADEVSFESSDIAPVYEAVVEMGVSPAEANALVDGYSLGTDVTPGEYALGIRQAYTYGRMGMPQSQLGDSAYAGMLTEQQMNSAYELGRIAGDQTAKATDATKRSAVQKGGTRKTGKVYFEGDTSALTDRQKVSIETLGKVAEAVGADIYLFESETDESGRHIGANGWYDPSDGSIHIDVYAGNDGKGTILFTAAHELTHFIKEWSPAKYKVFSDFLMDQYGKKGVTVDELVQRQIEKAARTGRDLSYDEAFDEVVADACETMLTDSKAVEKIARLREADKSLWNKIRSYFKDLLQRIKAVYDGLSPDSAEAQYVREMGDEVQRLYELWTEALADAGDVYGQTVDTNVAKTKPEVVKPAAKYSERYQSAEENLDILSMIERVESGNFKANEKVSLGIVSDSIAKQIQALTGINVDGFKVAIEARQIEHILKDHGKQGLADQSMAEPSNIAKMGYALNDPDEIRKAGKTQAYTHMVNGRNRTVDTVLYEKNIGTKSYYVVQAIPDTKAKTLYIVTAFIGKEGYKKEASQLINANSLDATAKTGSANASATSIPQSSDSVKRKFSERNITEITSSQYQAMVNHFGVTQNFDVAGYLLGNGAMLDFSGKHWGNTTSAFRQVDHRDIQEVLEDENSGVDAMINMIGNGNIRLMPETGGINLAVMPNDTQKNKLKEYIRHFKGEVIVDIDAVGGDTVQSFVYNRGTNPAVITRDIEAYFEDGATPLKQPEYRQYLYSERDTDSLSPRRILANALSEAAQNPYEASKLQQYKDELAETEKLEETLRKQRAEIRELSFAPGKRDQSYRDKLTALMIEAQKTQNRLDIRDKRLLRLEATKPLQELLVRERAKVRKRENTKYREKLAEQRATARETSEKRDARGKLQKLVIETANWLAHPAKNEVKCPDFLKEPYLNFLESIDLSSKRLLKDGEPTKVDEKLANTLSGLATAIERIQRGQDSTSSINDLPSEAFIQGYLDLPENFARELRAQAEKIVEAMETDSPIIANMTSADVKEISKKIRTLNHAIRELSTLYANQRFAKIEELGDKSIDYFESLGKKGFTVKGESFISWDNALPYYAFKRFGDTGMTVFTELMDGQDKLAFHAKSIFDFKEKNWTDKEAKTWAREMHTVKASDEMEFTLAATDIMTIYCLNKREQGRKHLYGEGIRIPGKKTALGETADVRAKLTEDGVKEITSKLSKRQIAVADAIQEFMSTVCAEWGNEISMKRFLTKEFTDPNYFPIETTDESRPVKDQAIQLADLYRLLNISATKGTIENATNAAVIHNIFEIFASHTSDMAKLNAFGLPLLDFMKWINYKRITEVKIESENGEEITQIEKTPLRTVMHEAFGGEAQKYALNLIKDVNGRYTDSPDHPLIMGFMRNTKAANVGGSSRTAVLQFTAYPRAAMVLSNRSLYLSLIENAAKVKSGIKKMQKYSGIAMWKSFGFYDTNIARTVEAQIAGKKTTRDTIIESTFTPAGLADTVTWGALWNACEHEVARANKTMKIGSEGFYSAVAEKFREVVYSTQVVDSVLTRSQIMRSKSGLTQTVTAYMSEPTVSANILMDAGWQIGLAQRQGKGMKKARAYLAKAGGVYVASGIIQALVESLMDAYRDEDEEKTWSEKYMTHLKNNLIQDIIPFNKIPLLSDIAEGILSLFDIGYFSTDSMQSAWLGNAITAVKTWTDVIGNEDSNKTLYKAVYDTSRAVSSVTGLAASNVMREVVDIWNHIVDVFDEDLKIRKTDLSKKQNLNRVIKAEESGDSAEAKDVFSEVIDMYAEKRLEDLTADNDKLPEYARSTEEKLKEDARKDALSDMKSELGDLYKDGGMEQSEAETYLAEYFDMSSSDIYWTMDKWNYAKEYGSTAGYSKYGTFIHAVSTGENLKQEIKRHIEHRAEGKSEKEAKIDLAGQITDYFKPLFLAASTTERADIQARCLTAYAALGYDREAKKKDIRDWIEQDKKKKSEAD